MNKQRPRRSTKSPSLFSHLPEELIPQILLRLPVRSLLRFKSVCKSWLSLISDPKFGKSHYDLAASPTYRCLTIANDSEIGSIDVDAPLLNYESSVVKLKYPLPPPCKLSLFSGNTVWFLGYCRGFVIVVYEQGDVFLWNPSTGVHKKFNIAHVSDFTFDSLHGFGYDTSTDDYLVVCMVLIPYDCFEEDPEDVADCYPTRISFFSLKTNSWFYPEGTYVQYWDNGEREFKVGCLLNEALHWLVTSYETKLQVVIAFDLVQRTLSEIPLSPTLSRKLEHKKYRYHLKVMGECLSLCYPGGGDSMVEIWREFTITSYDFEEASEDFEEAREDFEDAREDGQLTSALDEASEDDQ
ncbi:F-box/kelch-repeat protein At3g23880-like [Lotus japonicus]|uniref:F-box/kelch-repeat protein At3g23880-like n=1 Tax=Lotus japonicus TaxID=34305 RepID=UPI0025849BB5|nr:F-box/kelch-repeat protein At3g23880-like [Lotus japonicus]